MISGVHLHISIAPKAALILPTKVLSQLYPASYIDIEEEETFLTHLHPNSNFQGYV